jgi:arylsulfatase A-like enzyme
VGRLADVLQETGLAGTTLLVVTADHGEELWDRGGVEHGHTLHDEVVRVPLVIRCPGCTPRGAIVDAPVATAALAPTLLDLLGVAVAEDGSPDGGAALRPERGFAALLRGEGWQPRPIVSEGLLFAEERVALRTARHTYVLWPSGKEELYDRAGDPRELHDLAARAPLVRRHRRLLAAARGAMPPRAGGADDGRTPPDRDEVRLRRALVALGYVE